MVVSTYFAIATFIYLLVVTIAYFSKVRVKNNESIIFTMMVITNLFGLIFYFLSVGCAICDIKDVLYIVVKLLMVYFVFFTSEYYLYCDNIRTINKNLLYSTNKFKIISIITIITSILVFVLPMEFSSDNHYSFGISTNLVYAYSGIINSITTFMLIKNIKKYNKKKLIPVSVFIVSSIIAVIIQSFYPAEQFMIVVDSIIIFLMYFTIENPDVKMLEEFKIAKDKAEKANKEKELFLYNITQDIRIPLNNIKKSSNWINTNLDEIKKNDIKEGMYYINNNASIVLDKVNNVLDITNMEITNIKVYNTKYNIKLLLDELHKIYSKKIDKNIKLRFNVDSNIPELLNGDSLRLKQLLTIILDNSVKYTEKGFIELNLNTIVKKDVCRLVISIEDSGCGIKASEIDEIFSKDNQNYNNLDKIDDSKKNLAIAKSITTLLGGILMLESEIGSGTKITLVLDQSIYEEKSDELKKMETEVASYINKKKVMIVSEDNDYLNSVVKKLSKYDIEVIPFDLGSKCLEYIRLNKACDLIIIDELLNHLSALDILNKLKSIKTFNIKVAILTENIENKSYINDGFNYILNRKVDKKELDSLISEIEK